MLSGTRLEDARIHNCKTIIEAIRQNGPISRAEIARMTGLTTATISNLTSELIRQEIVLEARRRKGQRGQPAIELELNPNGRFAIGFELGRDNLSGVLINMAGQILGETHQEWEDPLPEIVLPLMARNMRYLLETTAISMNRFLGVGVAMPGPFLTEKKTVVFPAHFLPQWGRFPIVEKLTETLGLPAIVENDVMAAAIGELFHGVGHSYKDFFYLYLGAGIGGAMILNGHPYQGFSPNTGELGWIRCNSKDRQAVISRTLELTHLYDFLQSHELKVSEPKALLVLFKQQNTYLRQWLDEAVECLDIAINSINWLLGPKAIFLGGRLPGQIIDYLIEQLEIEGAAVKAAQPDEHILYQARILRATFGDLASALGAATLPLYQTFSTQPNLLQQNINFSSL
jgi:predicted NBD/HSP70 family sugar kinase